MTDPNEITSQVDRGLVIFLWSFTKTILFITLLIIAVGVLT